MHFECSTSSPSGRSARGAARRLRSPSSRPRSRGSSRSPRRWLTLSGCRSSMSCAARPAKSACATWSRCLRSPSPRSPTTCASRAAPASSCCTDGAQVTCCEPADKAACCGTAAAGGSCGCAAGGATAGETDIREVVRERYAEAARAVAERAPSGCGCGELHTTDASGTEVFGGVLYGEGEAQGATVPGLEASLGCGVPTAVADLREGETVLDLGSGAGADVLISARRVGPTGQAIGLDMTDEMLELARANAAGAGVENVRFLKGYLEDLPLED